MTGLRHGSFGQAAAPSSRARIGGASCFRPAAFTLIEMLAVIAIIAVLLVAVVPAVVSISRASALTNSAALLTDQLTAARQTALSRNRIVEVRFYKLPGELQGSATAYRAFRVFMYDDKALNASPLTAVLKLNGGVILVDDPKYSTLLSTQTNIRTLNPLTDTLPGVTDPVTYQAFRFRPTGGTDLDPGGAPGADKWFLTIKAELDPPADPLPAHNYVTAMIDPVSGRIRTFRP